VSKAYRTPFDVLRQPGDCVIGTSDIEAPDED
jgi:hypothetical protein